VHRFSSLTTCQRVQTLGYRAAPAADASQAVTASTTPARGPPALEMHLDGPPCLSVASLATYATAKLQPALSPLIPVPPPRFHALGLIVGLQLSAVGSFSWLGLVSRRRRHAAYWVRDVCMGARGRRSDAGNHRAGRRRGGWCRRDARRLSGGAICAGHGCIAGRPRKQG
jgi:hypothetical protein